LKQNSGLQKRKCNPRPGELAADLTGTALDAGESDCRIALSGAAAAIKMQSKKRLPATWLAGDCMNIHLTLSGNIFTSVKFENHNTANHISMKC